MKQPHWMHPPHQGLLDIQLAFPNTQLDIDYPPLNAIAKRDKRVEPFDTDKVADSIRKAAHSIGVEDEALSLSLASSVTLYLIQQTRMKGLSVADAIERVLVEMGHERIALAYVQHRQKQVQQKKLWKGDPPSEDVSLVEWHWNRSTSSVAVSPEIYIAEECERCAVPKSYRAQLHEQVGEKLTALAVQHPSRALILELTRQLIREDERLDIEPGIAQRNTR
jgi:hypothetical protein